MTVLADAADRERAIHERERNVLVDASAGTGKTKLVVDRLLELVAPSAGGTPIPIERIAAITFTRKAAGELRVRVRQRILESLAAIPPEAPRATALLAALAGVDTAHISTIHGFADRLLRQWPARARLDPRYRLVEDPSELIEESFQLLRQAADTSTLGELLAETPLAARADEAIATLRIAQRAGLQMRSREAEHWTYHGLDGLIAGFVVHRDVVPSEPELSDLDRSMFERYADELVTLVRGVSASSPGGRWLHEIADRVRSVRDEPDAAAIYAELVARLEAGPRGRSSLKPTRGDDFGGDEQAWSVWRALDGDPRKRALRVGSLRDDLLAPLRRWIAVRLVRLRPIAVHLYETVKARHQAVDHIDLMLRLRDLLRDDREVRRACQGQLDHLFVDEFQDTDPLQAEIVLFLCERGTSAAVWTEVGVAPGKLTLVGDPKQSIYRFRRADLSTYQRVVEIVERGPHLSVRLSSSFRSTPQLVEWINGRFDDLLGASATERFRHETGEVFHQRLTQGRASGGGIAVHAVTMSPPDGDAVAQRAFEAGVSARYIRWLVHASGLDVVDPVTLLRRPIAYGDIAVLAVTTTHLPLLFGAFERDSVPHAARGGSLFLRDPVHRRFLLALAALADREDGVATAALLRPPFFALNLGELARARVDEATGSIADARAVVAELRRRRFERSPGQTARALLEETGLARTIALGPNGAQRVSALRELCFQVDLRASDAQLDFDGAVEQLRSWVASPPGLDPPHPVGDAAVRVLTIHQAKGLEFPVVVLWDSRALWTEQTMHEAWTVERDARAWAVSLDHAVWEEPRGADLARRERELRYGERKRLAYVAATRARDLLVIPAAGGDGRYILSSLLGATRDGVLVQPLHTAETHAGWFTAASPPRPEPPGPATARDVEIRSAWDAAAALSARPVLQPRAFTDAANPRALWRKRGRFGTRFGDTVHRAIGVALRTGAVPSNAVATAAKLTGLDERLAEAADDVDHALAALAELRVGSVYELEYPVSGLVGDRLLSGYVDFLASVEGGIVLLDFKTDAPPTEAEQPPDRYVDQVLGYAGVVARAWSLPVRAGLLYTADGGVRWLSEP
jgi:ATP-dependent helicase/nuclease subunit A